MRDRPPLHPAPELLMSLLSSLPCGWQKKEEEEEVGRHVVPARRVESRDNPLPDSGHAEPAARASAAPGRA